ncbi:MAG: hypothetical protein ACOCUT_03080 [bacterium]
MSKDFEKKFIDAVDGHLEGWAAKVNNDFSEINFNRELKNLQSDPVYADFKFDTAEYVLIRLMGRMSISIGRRLGEIYDKIPRFAAAAKFDLSPEQIAPKFDGLELDISIILNDISEGNQNHVNEISKKYLKEKISGGLGIEIRYNFNPNDSSRLRKDVKMGEILRQENYTPVYLVFSSISPRQDAISRLTNSGWNFLIGENAVNFMNELLEIDLATILKKKEISQEIKKSVDDFMKNIYDSHAFQQVILKHKS